MAAKILVTGANKGIGLAITRSLLDGGCYVFLGSRDVDRGAAALESIVGEQPKFKDSAEVVQLDVTNDASVSAAFENVKAKVGSGGLTGLINNAGGAAALTYTGHEDFLHVIDLNLHGLVRVTEAFLPLLSNENGRIVNISSGSAPSFVAKCAEARKRMLCNPKVAWSDVLALVGAASAISAKGGETAAFEATGLPPGDGIPYGFSKACVNAYGMVVARENPNLKINSCSPGFIETDLTRPIAEARGQTPSEMGMLQPEQSTVAPVFLMLDDVPTPKGQSYYYGSDAKRSPMHKPRSPGDAPYAGEDDV